MRLRTFKYFFQQSMSSLQRNGWMSIASIATISICLMVLGSALLIFLNTNKFITTVESDVEIVAYIDEQIPATETADLAERISDLPGVAEVVFISKDQALQEMKQKFDSSGYDLNTALKGQNPLPDAYKLKVEEPREVILIAQELEKWPAFEKVRYGQGVVENLFSVTRWIKWISLALMVFLAVTAIFVIATTIRLAMNARQAEIEIMKMVGATDWFIRWPFLLEGLFLGLIGAILAVGILSGSYLVLLNNLKTSVAFLPLVSEPRILFHVFGGMLGTGLLLGTIGTVLSIYRFLHV